MATADDLRDFIARLGERQRAELCQLLRVDTTPARSTPPQSSAVSSGSGSSGGSGRQSPSDGYSHQRIGPTPCRRQPLVPSRRLNLSSGEKATKDVSCQSAVRQHINKLMAGQGLPGSSVVREPLTFNFDKFEENREIVNKLITEIRRFWNNRYSAGEIEEAIRRCWRHKKEEIQREESGKKMHHRQASKENKRRRDKMNRRRKALDLVPWDEDIKTDIRKVLIREATSPEKSDEEDNVRKRIAIAWESSELTRKNLIWTLPMLQV